LTNTLAFHTMVYNAEHQTFFKLNCSIKFHYLIPNMGKLVCFCAELIHFLAWLSQTDQEYCYLLVWYFFVVVMFLFHLGLMIGNCDQFYFTFEFKVRMWVSIYQIFKRDQIPICHLSNKSNLNTDKCYCVHQLDKCSSLAHHGAEFTSCCLGQALTSCELSWKFCMEKTYLIRLYTVKSKHYFLYILCVFI